MPHNHPIVTEDNPEVTWFPASTNDPNCPHNHDTDVMDKLHEAVMEVQERMEAKPDVKWSDRKVERNIQRAIRRRGHKVRVTVRGETLQFEMQK